MAMVVDLVGWEDLVAITDTPIHHHTDIRHMDHRVRLVTRHTVHMDTSNNGNPKL